jgi:hypothetical protein
MNKSLGSILLLIVAGLLLGYTAFRSVDILRQTLPEDAQVLAYIGLAGLDGGLVAWTIFRLKSARGEAQNAISLLMVIVQLAGVAITSIGDSLMRTAGAVMPDYVLLAVTWGVPAIIAINIVAYTAIHLTDPGAAIERARREMEDEIKRQTAEQIRASASTLAGTIAPEAAAHHARQLRAEIGFSGNGNGKDKPAMVYQQEGVDVALIVRQVMEEQAKANRPQKARASQNQQP